MKNKHHKIEFSIDGYSSLIVSILDTGYTVVDFDSEIKQNSQILLRHDIDFSLEAALDVARVENKIGVISSFYILVSSEFYNIFTRRSHEILSEIIDLGHEIGLHFDSSRYDNVFEKIDDLVNYECVILENVISKPINSISFHRPDMFFHGLDRKIAGRTHTYHPSFFKDIAYISDSGGAFKYGNPLDHHAFHDRKTIQLLTHPIWWPAVPVINNMQLVDVFLFDRTKFLKRHAELNCKNYSNHCNK